MFDSPLLRITQLPPEQEDIALRLALTGLLEAEFQQQTAALRAWSKRHSLGGYQVWGAYRKEKLTGALLLQTLPGRTAVVWPPRLVEPEPPDTAHQLLRSGLAGLPGGGVALVQALLPTEVGADAEVLEAVGFKHVSDLLYLVCLAEGFPRSLPAPELRLEPSSHVNQRRLEQLVDATYVDTFDCPAVNGVRRVEEVLDGYRATGEFDPARWCIVRHRGEDVGCLILTDYPEHATWELIYMGIVPAARGRGLGIEIVRHAQWLAGQGTCQRLVLAVDAANEPALKTYAATGFQAWDRRSVYILLP